MKKFLNFEKARKVVRSLQLKNCIKWHEYRENEHRSNKVKDIPSHPEVTYKNNGWISWSDWLGTKNVQSRKYSVNDDFFKTWSHDMAYILGFWWADGWISKNRFSVSQKESRSYILRKILKIMKSKAKIHKNKNNCCHFSITSGEIIQDILNLGGTSHKSLNSVYPIIPNKYFPSFVRGYFDGDGCISICNDKNKYRVTFTCSSYEFLFGLYKQLKENIDGLNGYIQKRAKNTKNIHGRSFANRNPIYILSFGINDARRLKKFMYNKFSGSLYLREKYFRFQDLGEISGEYLKRSYPSYEVVKVVANSNGIDQRKKWEKFARDCQLFPVCPHKVYKNNGWQGWDVFLNRKKI